MAKFNPVPCRGKRQTHKNLPHHPRSPKLQPGEHVMEIALWRLNESRELQIKHVSVAHPEFEPVWRTFKSKEEALHYIGALTEKQLLPQFEEALEHIEALTEKQLPQFDSAILNTLIGVTFKAVIKPGKKYFMNLTRVLEVVQPPIFNTQKPVNECKSAAIPKTAIPETDKGGQDARQTSFDFP